MGNSGGGAPGEPGGGSGPAPGGGGRGPPGMVLGAGEPGGGAPGRAPDAMPGGGPPGAPGGGGSGPAPGAGGRGAPGKAGGAAPGTGAPPGKAEGAASFGLALPTRRRQCCASLAWPLMVGPHEIAGRFGSKFCANAAELTVMHITVADFAMALVSCLTFVPPNFLLGHPSKRVFWPTKVQCHRGSGSRFRIEPTSSPYFQCDHFTFL
jgi:hypothetical protein